MTAIRTTRPSRRAALTDRGFVVHYLQMLAAMAVGTGVGTALIALAGGHGQMAGDARAEVHALLMATWMTVGTAVWMAGRRQRWPAIIEMGLAMYLAFVVLFPGYWLGVLSGRELLVAGHVLMLLATGAVMLRRREDYVGR